MPIEKTIKYGHVRLPVMFEIPMECCQSQGMCVICPFHRHNANTQPNYNLSEKKKSFGAVRII